MEGHNALCRVQGAPWCELCIGKSQGTGQRRIQHRSTLRCFLFECLNVSGVGIQLPLTYAGMQPPLAFAGMQYPLTCAGMQHPLICAWMQLPLTCTGMLHPLTCAGMQHPLTCAGMQHSLTCAGLQHPLTCAGMQYPNEKNRLVAVTCDAARAWQLTTHSHWLFAIAPWCRDATRLFAASPNQSPRVLTIGSEALPIPR